MDIFGVPISIWHALIVEEPTGISVFVILALAARVVTDVFSTGQPETPRVRSIRQASDTIAYFGSFAAAFFITLAGITGYLIQPYSSLITQPILINIALLALAALFFWSAYFVLRFVSGPDLWSHTGLYVLAIVTATLGLLFDALAASVGAELSLGESVLQPLYADLNFSWRTFTIQPVEIEATLALVMIGIAVALIALIWTPKSKPAQANA